MGQPGATEGQEQEHQQEVMDPSRGSHLLYGYGGIPRQSARQIRRQLRTVESPLMFEEWIREKHQSGKSYRIAAEAVVHEGVRKPDLDLVGGDIPEGPLVGTIRRMQQEKMDRIQKEREEEQRMHRWRRLTGKAGQGGAMSSPPKGSSPKSKQSTVGVAGADKPGLVSAHAPGGKSQSRHGAAAETKAQPEGPAGIALQRGVSIAGLQLGTNRNEEGLGSIGAADGSSDVTSDGMSVTTGRRSLTRRRMCPFTRQALNLLTAAPGEELRLPGFMYRLKKGGRRVPGAGSLQSRGVKMKTKGI